MRSTRLLAAAAAIALPLLVTATAMAGYKTCGGQRVPDGTRQCPDGAIPMYHSSPVQPMQPAQPVQGARQPAAGTADLLGVWHTAVPGGVWQTPSAVPGWDLLHIRPGVRSGDLTIDGSGRYVWNSYGGKTGQWEPSGDRDYPIVLIDTAERKQWKVGPDRRNPGRIFIWDGYVHYTGNR